MIMYKYGLAQIDDGPVYGCIYNPEYSWNGWRAPHVSSDYIEAFVRDFGVDNEFYSLTWEGGIYKEGVPLIYIDKSEPTEPIIEYIRPHMYEGKRYYNLTNMCFCFHIKE